MNYGKTLVLEIGNSQLLIPCFSLKSAQHRSLSSVYCAWTAEKMDFTVLTMYHMLDHFGSLKWMKLGSLLACRFTRGFTSCCWAQSTWEGDSNGEEPGEIRTTT